MKFGTWGPLSRKANNASAVDKVDSEYQKKARDFYDVENAAIVETVFRKPQRFASVHSLDDKDKVYRVPTAIGFHSMDSADEADRYEIQVPEERETTVAAKKDTKEEPKQQQQEEVREGAVISGSLVKSVVQKLEKERKEKAKQEKAQKVETKPSEKEEVVVEPAEPEKEEPAAVEPEEIVKQDSEDDTMYDGDDKYGYTEEMNMKSIFSADESCPPMWKSFSEEESEELDEDAKEAAKRRRETALEEAKKLRALNSVPDGEEPAWVAPDESSLDPRIYRTAASDNSKKSKKLPKFTLPGSGKTIRSKLTKKSNKTKSTKSKSSESSKKNSVGTENSIIEKEPMVEPQTAPAKEDTQKSPKKEKREETNSSKTRSFDEDVSAVREESAEEETEPQPTFTTCVFEGLTTLAATVDYWMGDGENKDTEVHELKKVASPKNRPMSPKSPKKLASPKKSGSPRKFGSPRKLGSPKKKSMELSEISIPTPHLNGLAEKLQDDISILGLQKGKNKKQKKKMQQEQDENSVPQQVKKSGKKSMFGKVLNRKTKA